MAVNQFLPFATGGGSLTLADASYAALAARLTGFTNGVADPAQVNKVWRQSSVMAAMTGQFIAANSGQDALDNGDINTLQSRFEAAIAAIANGSTRLHVGSDSSTTANTVTVTNFAPATSDFVAGHLYLILVANQNTGAVNVNGTQMVRSDAQALQGGDILAGQEVLAAYDGARLQVVNFMPSQITSSTVYNYLAATVGSQFFYSNLGAVPDIAQVTNADANTNTMIGQVTIPAGFINMTATVTCDVPSIGATTAATEVYIDIWISGDGGSTWTDLEFTHATKPAGQTTITLSRTALRNLDRGTSYLVRATARKLSATGVTTPPESSLQVQALRS